MTVQIFGALIASVFAAGTAADNLISYPHKKTWHDKAVRFWMRLDETSVPNLPRLLAQWVIKISEKLSNTRWKAFLVYLGIVTVFLMIALPLISREDPPVEPPQSLRLQKDIFDASSLPHIAVTATVMCFDIITLFLTVGALRVIQRSTLLRSVLTYFAHLIILIFLAICCYASVNYVSFKLINNNVLGARYERQVMKYEAMRAFNYFAARNTNSQQRVLLSTNAVVKSLTIANSFTHEFYRSAYELYHLAKGEKTESIIKSVTVLQDGQIEYKWEFENAAPMSKIDLLLVGTLSFPMICLMFTFGFLVIAKILLTIFRRYSLYFIDLATEKPPDQFKPFFLIACSVDLLLLLVVAVKQLMSTL
jgi:hypothetical protein